MSVLSTTVRPPRARVARVLTSTLLATVATVGPFDYVTAITNANKTTLMPWSVFLEFWKPGPTPTHPDMGCTGTALSQHWIVTAAHCLKGRSIHTHEVAVSSEWGPIYRGKASYYNHPEHGRETDLADDIGLIRLYGLGMVPDVRGKIENGPRVADPDRWRDLLSRPTFFVTGYGKGSSQFADRDCPSAPIVGIKRVGIFRLTGITDDNGILNAGNPIAVQAEEVNSRLCDGDSGAGWAFSTLGDIFDDATDMRVFAVYAGTRHGHDYAVLIPPRMKWITDKAAAEGLPLSCPAYGERGDDKSYRGCTEGFWMMSAGGKGEWEHFKSTSTPLSRVSFVDYDGDGHVGDAVVSSPNGQTFVLYNDEKEWKPAKKETFQTPLRLRLGDFDGDGTTDLLRNSGPYWSVSFGKADRKGDPTGWVTVGTAPQTSKGDPVSVNRLGVGDFDGDGADDVLFSSGGYLKISFATKDRTQWTRLRNLATSEVTSIRYLQFGDFDGDGVTDVFRRGPTNDRWWVAYGSHDRSVFLTWTLVNSSRHPLSSFRFADFDGNGTTDVFLANGAQWSVSYAPKERVMWSRWVHINRSSHPSSSLAVADVDGDGRADVLYGSAVRPPS